MKTVQIFKAKQGGVLALKKKKNVKLNVIALPNGKLMKEIYENGYKHQGIVELDKIKDRHMKGKLMSENKTGVSWN